MLHFSGDVKRFFFCVLCIGDGELYTGQLYQYLPLKQVFDYCIIISIGALASSSVVYLDYF